MNKIWMIETKWKNGKRWQPLEGPFYTKREASEKLSRFDIDPNREFRVSRYESVNYPT